MCIVKIISKDETLFPGPCYFLFCDLGDQCYTQRHLSGRLLHAPHIPTVGTGEEAVVAWAWVGKWAAGASAPLYFCSF